MTPDMDTTPARPAWRRRGAHRRTSPLTPCLLGLAVTAVLSAGVTVAASAATPEGARPQSDSSVTLPSATAGAPGAPGAAARAGLFTREMAEVLGVDDTAMQSAMAAARREVQPSSAADRQAMVPAIARRLRVAADDVRGAYVVVNAARHTTGRDDFARRLDEAGAAGEVSPALQVKALECYDAGLLRPLPPGVR